MPLLERCASGVLAAVLWATLAGPAAAQMATAELAGVDGKPIGAVLLSETPAGVLFRLSLKGLPAGERAFHVHAVGKCEPPFTTAGGHFNPGARKHGLLVAAGHHAGDMPNLHIPASGELAIELVNDAVTLQPGKPHSLLDSDGSALVIHAGKDDYRTDPAGDAGGRIACGVVVASAARDSAGPATANVGAPIGPASSSPAPPPAKGGASVANAGTDIVYDQPIPTGPQPVNGRSIKELIEAVPLFPPIQWLDEAIWKQPCASCHKWNKERLCDQGKTYQQTTSAAFRHAHPFGGAFKLALLQWAKTGCK